MGGLGLGYTLRAALDALPLTARVIVAELVAEVVDWNRGPLAPLAGCPLEDARVTIHVGNIGDVVRRAERCYDSILLDVDNGPAALACRGNGWLYSAEGLAAIRRALREPGILAVWSADPSAAFEASLRAADFRVESIGVPARQGAGAPMHTIFLADMRREGQ